MRRCSSRTAVSPSSRIGWATVVSPGCRCRPMWNRRSRSPPRPPAPEARPGPARPSRRSRSGRWRRRRRGARRRPSRSGTTAAPPAVVKSPCRHRACGRGGRGSARAARNPARRLGVGGILRSRHERQVAVAMHVQQVAGHRGCGPPRATDRWSSRPGAAPAERGGQKHDDRHRAPPGVPASVTQRLRPARQAVAAARHRQNEHSRSSSRGSPRSAARTQCAARPAPCRGSPRRTSTSRRSPRCPRRPRIRETQAQHPSSSNAISCSHH